MFASLDEYKITYTNNNLGFWCKALIGSDRPLSLVEKVETVFHLDGFEFGFYLSELEYWKNRCLLAEKCLGETPCDPDITFNQRLAWGTYYSFISKFGDLDKNYKTGGKEDVG